MKFFDDSVAAMVIPDSPVDLWLDAAAVVLQDDTFENTWSAEQGVAARIAWRFSNGFVMDWFHGGGGELGSPDTVQVWWDPPMGHGEVCPLEGMTWDSSDSTWMMENVPSSVLQFILEDAIGLMGEPTVYLPWDGFTENEEFETAGAFFDKVEVAGGFLDMLGGMDDDVLEEMEATLYENAMWDSENEDEKPPAGMQVLLAARMDGVVSAWGSKPVMLTSCDAFMPPQSQYMKFVAFMEAMDEKPNWIVVWNECCGTCAGSSRRMMADEKKIPEDSPSLVHFGQQSQYAFNRDGSVSYQFYLNSDEQVQEALAVAQSVGLKAAPAQDGTAKDLLTIG